MSFSYDIKHEIAHNEPERKCCRLAEIAGYLRLRGSIKLLGRGRFGIALKTDNPAIARHYKMLIDNYFSISARINSNSSSTFEGKYHEIVIDPDMNAEQILRETGILVVREGMNDISEGINEGLIRTKCCRKAYLKGLFLAGGTISDPKRGYHLEIVSSTEMLAYDIRRLLNSFIDIHAKISKRKTSYAVYIKDSEQIKDILNIIGAHTKLFEFENVRIYKEIRNKTNRISNCDNANLDRVIEAGSLQIDAINKIGLANMPKTLLSLARLRLEHPEASLAELGEMSVPPMKKSTVYYKFKKLVELAGRMEK